MSSKGRGATVDPVVTISLVTYDGARWLPGCLASIAEQTLRDHEVLILDNASRDDSAAIAQEWATSRTRVRVKRSAVNLGYAAAHNRHIFAAAGAFVLLLNQDVELDPGFLTAALRTFEQGHDIGAVQARLRRLDGPGDRSTMLDSTGLEMGRDRRAVSRSQGQPDGPGHAAPEAVWGADGPAPIYRTRALLDARLPRTGGGWEVLDEDFFLYKEDVDLAWRLRSLGWRTMYQPSALAWHARGTGPTGATSMIDIARANRSIQHGAKALSWRNQRLMQIKNEAPISFVRDAPWILARESLSLGYLLFMDPRRLGAVAGFLRLAPAAMRKRQQQQARLRAKARRSRP